MRYITLKIENNTTVKVPVFLLGNAGDPEFNSDNTTLVEWDLSTEPFTGNTVTIDTTPPFTLPLTDLSVEGVATALNTLNLAIFNNDGTTLYATYLLNATVATADVIVGNAAFDINGWTQINSLANAFSPDFTATRFSEDGLFYFINDQSVPEILRFPLGTAWDLTTLSLISDQSTVINAPGFMFGNSGLFLYSLTVLTWFRFPIGVSYDLTTVGAQDESLAIGANNNWGIFNPSGAKFWRINADVITEYTASGAWSIVGPASVSTNVNTITPIDGLTLEALLFSNDGTKLFILKSQAIAPFLTIIYQCTCSTPFTISTATYDNISVSFNATEEVVSFQFNDTGSGFFTTEGNASQIIREFG